MPPLVTKELATLTKRSSKERVNFWLDSTREIDQIFKPGVSAALSDSKIANSVTAN
jgi:hypothetical protein